MQDKKKMMVLAALALAIVAVGAFQLTRPADTPPVASKEKTETPTEEPTEEGSGIVAENTEGEEPVRNPQLAQALPARDPFKEASLPGGDLTTQKPVPVPTAPPKLPNPAGRRGPRGGGNTGGLTPYRFDTSGSIPGVGGPVGISPAPELDAFAYQVSGIIVGKRPAAVFTDGQGAQRLVSEGGSLDGDSRVVKIEKGHVVIKHRGKTLRLTVGGTP